MLLIKATFSFSFAFAFTIFFFLLAISNASYDRKPSSPPPPVHKPPTPVHKPPPPIHKPPLPTHKPPSPVHKHWKATKPSVVKTYIPPPAPPPVPTSHIPPPPPIPTAYSPPPPPLPTTSLAYQFLTPHNIARNTLGIAPLSWNDQLTSYAQWYANQRLYGCALIHSGGPYGENIFWGSGSDWTPGLAVEAWMNEKQYYDYYTNSCIDGQDCGHYTQIVWRSSTQLGCARVVCENGAGVFITCNYDPPGNYIGERPY
ncbi:Pathogenesis-related protein [Drosera capensis]